MRNWTLALIAALAIAPGVGLAFTSQPGIGNITDFNAKLGQCTVTGRLDVNTQSAEIFINPGNKRTEDLFARLNGTRTFHAAMQLLRQLEFALFDMRLHSMESPVSAQEIQGVLDQVRRQIAVVHPPATNRFQNSFTHIFAGGYSAGYYSYKWAEVLSADAYSRFEEEGLFNNAVGSDYVREILEVGSSRPALESFISFRGREPKMDAFLRHSGLEVSV